MNTNRADMFSKVFLVLLVSVAICRGAVLYHRQPAAGPESPDYLDDGGLRYLKFARTLALPVQVALPSVPAVNAVPAAGPVVLAAASPQFLVPRVALAVPQHYAQGIQQYSSQVQQYSPAQYHTSNAQPQQYSSPSSQLYSHQQQPSQYTQSRDNHQQDYERPYSRQQHEQFHYTNKHN